MNSTNPRHAAILARVQAADGNTFFHPESDPDAIVTLATGLASEAVCGELEFAAMLAETCYGIPLHVSHLLANAALPVLYPLAARVRGVQLLADTTE